MTEQQSEVRVAINSVHRSSLRWCLTGMSSSFAIVAPLKHYGFMPEHLTWLRMTVALGAPYAWLISLFAGKMLLRERSWILIGPISLVCVAAMLGVVWWEG